MKPMPEAIKKINNSSCNDVFSFSKIDKLSLIFFISIAFLSTLVFCLNHYYWHYPPVNYFANGIIGIFFFLLFSALGSYFLAGLSSRVTQVFFYVLAYHLIICMAMYATTAVQLTPFAPIDPALVRMDRFLHYDAIKMLEILSAHSWIREQLSHAYNFGVFELLFLPIFLMIRGEFELIKQYFYLLLFTTLVGFSFYFFWPTMAPASVLKSAYFLSEQHNTGYKFYQIHHLIPASSDGGGLISMPSFHMIWALLCQYAARRVRWLWWGILPMNILVVLSAIFLGWHYLVDFLGSAILIAMGLLFSYLCCRTEKKLAYTQHLNFRQGVSEADEGVYNKYMTEVDAAYNAAENSSAKCIERFF